MLAHPHIMRSIAVAATRQLSHVDYAVANRVTESVADIVQLAYRYDLPNVAHIAVHLLHFFDDAGSFLIALVATIVDHVW